jgi:hypothetical protein
MIPFVLAELLVLSERFPIRRLRLAREPFFISAEGTVPPHLGPNLAKHLLLNALSHRHAPLLAAKGIATNAYLIGVLYTGRMTLGTTAAALHRLADRGTGDGVEVLFHPGGAEPGEETLWSDKPRARTYYCSPWRAREAATLKSIEFANLIRRFRASASDRSR